MVPVGKHGGSMDEQELRELQDPDTWADDEDELHAPVKAPRAVVSVGFAREDFERVVDYAERQGLKTSELIRQATLERIASEHTQVQPPTVLVTVSNWVRTEYPVNWHRGTKVKVVGMESAPSFATT